MAKAILRTAKLKSASGVRGCAEHNSRSRFTVNADRTRQNETMVDGGQDVYETVMKHIADSGVMRKIRDNAVLAQEIFLSASPEYFRPSDPAAAGTWEQDRMEQWRDASLKFLQGKYGGHMIDCRLHLDESTPHLHAIVVPIVQGPKGSKLSAKECFGRVDLQRLQDEYPKALQSAGLDIERGIKGSKAKHTKIQEYYGIANRNERRYVPKITKTPPMMVTQNQRNEYKDRINSQFFQCVKPVFQKARGADLERKKRKEYESTAQALSKQNEQLKAQLRAANEAARETPLSLVLEKAGLEPSPRDIKQWIGGGHRITIKGQKWFDHNAGDNGRGAGGAIDLVMHLENCDFRKAVAWLGQTVSIDEATRAIRDQARATAESCAKIDIAFQAPEPAPEGLPIVRDYLIKKRCLKPALVDSLIKKGDVYATRQYQHINAVFLCKNSVGITACEIRGTEPGKKFHQTIGPRKEGAFTIGSVTNANKHAVFVESAIDAISYYQLKGPDVYVISTSGASTAPQFCEHLLQEGWQFTVAYDNDENKTGQSFAKKFQQKFPDAKIDIPYTKDWNDDLKQIQKKINALKKLQKVEVGRIKCFQNELFERKYASTYHGTLQGLFIGINPSEPGVEACIFGTGVELIDKGGFLSCYGSDLQHQAEIAIEIAVAKGWDMANLEIKGSPEWIEAVMDAVSQKMQFANGASPVVGIEPNF